MDGMLKATKHITACWCFFRSTGSRHFKNGWYWRKAGMAMDFYLGKPSRFVHYCQLNEFFLAHRRVCRHLSLGFLVFFLFRRLLKKQNF